MLFRLGLLVVRFRWLVVVLWAVVLVLALLFAPRASSVLKGGFGDADVESRRGLEIMTDRLGLPEASLNVVFSSPTLEATDPAFVEEMQRVLRPLEALPEVPRVITHYGSGNPALISRDGQAAMALVFLDVGIDEAIHRYKEFRARISSDSLDIQVTGGVPIFSDLNDASTRDLRRAEIIVFPLVLIALVVVFGSVVAAGLPLAMGGLAVAVTLALIYGVAQLIDVSIFVLNITTLLGVGIAIDYSLLVVSRFREELLSRPRDEAVAVTVATAGRTLFFSGLTSATGFSGLFLFEYMMLRSLGVGGILVVLLSMALSLTLLPALLAILGHRVNALAVLPARPDRAGVWGRVARGVMRHPVLVSAPIVVGLLVLGLPFLDVKLGAPWASILPQESEARRGWDSLSERFGPGAASPILAVVTAPVPIGQAPDLVGRLYDYARVLQDDPRVERVESIVTVRPEITKAQYQRIYAEPALVPFPPTGDILPRLAYGDTTVLRIFEAQAPLSDTSKELVRHIRATAPGDGVEVYVTGATADIMDAVDVMYRDFPQGHRLHPGDHVPGPPLALPLPCPPAEGGAVERLERLRQLRRPGIRLPAGPLPGSPGVHRPGGHRGHCSHPHVLSPLRHQHGLRDLPVEPDQGVLRGDGRHRRQRRHGLGADGARHHQLIPHTGDGAGRHRHGGRRAGQGPGRRHGRRNLPGRDPRARAAGPGADAGARQVELVALYACSPGSQGPK